MQRAPSYPASLAAGIAFAVLLLTTARAAPRDRVYIRDPYVHDAVAQALRSAAESLQTPKCQTLLTEFSDERGRTLTERLGEMRMSLAEYVGAIIIRDGEQSSQCSDGDVLAFTAVGSRVVYVCGPAFVRAAKRDTQEVKATLVHELLHSLGLGENPPSSRQITYRVKQLCW